MRFAGTCAMYSNRAIPQEIAAAMYHGRACSSLRCAYQAKVMKTFESTSSSTVCTITGIPFLRFGPQDRSRVDLHAHHAEQAPRHEAPRRIENRRRPARVEADAAERAAHAEAGPGAFRVDAAQLRAALLGQQEIRAPAIRRQDHAAARTRLRAEDRHEPPLGRIPQEAREPARSAVVRQQAIRAGE